MFEGLRFNHWKTSQDEDGVVTLALDRDGSSVNAISREVLDELEQIVERLAIDKPAGVIIHSAKQAGFAVGADIKEFVEYARERYACWKTSSTASACTRRWPGCPAPRWRRCTAPAWAAAPN